MKDENPRENRHAIELQTDLIEQGVIPSDLEIDLYQQVHGGADTTIFEIGFKNHSTKYIQRILRLSASRASAEFEFTNQKTLFENGINVPETFLIKHPPNTYGRSYYVMQKIEGTPLDDVFRSHPEQFEELVNSFILELVKIHSINPSLLSLIPKMDIENNPYAVIDQALRGIKLRIERFPDDLVEMSVLVNWLDENKTKNPCNELVVIHGDYHPLNIIVDDQHRFQILDWTGINISDFRRDLGFTATILSAGTDQNLAPLIAKKYEELTGKKVENLEYFMILSSAWNLLRMYSGLNNHAINNESEETLRFFKSIREYPLLLVDLVSEECGIELKQIRRYFSE